MFFPISYIGSGFTTWVSPEGLALRLPKASAVPKTHVGVAPRRECAAAYKPVLYGVNLNPASSLRSINSSQIVVNLKQMLFRKFYSLQADDFFPLQIAKLK